LFQNYEEFFEIICHFGIGIIILPTLIHSMGGSYSITSNEASPIGTYANKGTLGTSFLSNLGTVVASRLESSQILVNGVTESQSIKPSRRIKIFFLLTFDQAELTKKVQSPYCPFNPYKENSNGKQLYKSPLIKSSKSCWLVSMRSKLAC